MKSEIEKLYIERDSLLGSGIYNENDPLIQQLENRIRKLLDVVN